MGVCIGALLKSSVVESDKAPTWEQASEVARLASPGRSPLTLHAHRRVSLLQ